VRFGSFHDLLWENSFSVNAAVVDSLCIAYLVIWSMYLDFVGRMLVPYMGGTCGSCGRELAFGVKQTTWKT
jgi:hypothetical protein